VAPPCLLSLQQHGVKIPASRTAMGSMLATGMYFYLTQTVSEIKVLSVRYPLFLLDTRSTQNQ